MGRICVLADSLIDRIAAGEVVDRPSSVVKELVENALDAGAGRIEVELRGGGKQSIRVTDDGSGMEPDDARLAVQRHATSKVRTPEDLESIATLGFRGEALSSIAAVSHFVLRTSTCNGEGTEIEVRGGHVERVASVGLPAGTTLLVERLFHNVPARRKFLRADATELSHSVRWLTRYALAYPRIAFTLIHGGRRLLDAPAAADRLERIAQVFGREFAGKMLPVEARSEGLAVRGLAGRPVEALPRRDAQHLFVNGRAVQDRVLGHAVTQAYGNTLPYGRHPALVLHVDLDPAAVDVNVHPQKTEVRFRDSSRVHDLVRGALYAALSNAGAVPSLGDLRPGALPRTTEGVRAATLRYLETREPGSPGFEAPVGPPTRSVAGVTGGLPAEERRPAVRGDLLDKAAASIPGEPQRVAACLGQIRDSYIVAQDRSGLLLVDQHAAHERVLYERYLEEARLNRVEVQRLLFPVTIELAPHEHVLLESELGELRRLGFRLEPFGGTSVRIDGVPALAGELEVEPLLRELLGEAAAARSAAADVAGLRARLVTSAACQAAIKVNRPMSGAEMQGLLDDLFAAGNPTTCPHGRPAIFRLTLDEIERAFQRR